MKLKNLLNEEKTLNTSQAIKVLEKWIASAKKYGFDTSDYKITARRHDGFHFNIDGELYTIINDYFSDGYNPGKLGEKFETLFKGTNWAYEPYSSSMYIFYRDDLREGVIQEFSSKFHQTVIVITGKEKGDSQRLFQKVAKEMDKNFPNEKPKQIRIDF